MELHESGENYLETILVLKNRNGFVRAVDIAAELGFSKPSISRAMGILKSAGYIVVEKTGNIVLTAEGLVRASQVYERHILITKFLIMALEVDEKTADADACRIEHIISDKTFSKIRQFVKSREDGAEC